MKDQIAGTIDDKSGAAGVGPVSITIFLPMLCLLILIATGVSMITGTSLMMAPNVIAEALNANVFAR